MRLVSNWAEIFLKISQRSSVGICKWIVKHFLRLFIFPCALFCSKITPKKTRHLPWVQEPFRTQALLLVSNPRWLRKFATKYVWHVSISVSYVTQKCVLASWNASHLKNYKCLCFRFSSACSFSHFYEGKLSISSLEEKTQKTTLLHQLT